MNEADNIAIAMQRLLWLGCKITPPKKTDARCRINYLMDMLNEDLAKYDAPRDLFEAFARRFTDTYPKHEDKTNDCNAE